MIDLPETDGVPVIRVDFSDDGDWAQLCADLAAEDHQTGYLPNLTFVERRDLVGVNEGDLEDQVPRTYPSTYDQPFLVIVDGVTMASPERPVLIIDLNEDDTSTSFRAIPREVAAIEANLSLANMDFFDFGESTDHDGIFRGFK